MRKQAISVTLGSDNLTWLAARVAATGARSVSELLDRLVTDARSRGEHPHVRSVVGTIAVDAGDSLLDGADAAIRAIFDRSLRRPLAVKESRPRHAGPRRSRGRRA
jgi:hypothetical protein